MTTKLEENHPVTVMSDELTDLRKKIDEAMKRREEDKKKISLDDFRAYMPMHNYIFIPSRDYWPASSVNARLGSVSVRDIDGSPKLDEKGKPIKVSASAWLDKHRPVEQMTWAPGMPMLIPDRLIAGGGWTTRLGVTCFNLYQPPTITPGDARKAGPWLKLVRRLYHCNACHIVRWLAHRVQRPGEKINHAIIFGGEQGIGKDTVLEPVRRAVGPWNFQEVSPKMAMGTFTYFLKSVILRVSEMHDLGDADRYDFYDHMKTYTAAPPDILSVNEKHLRQYYVTNCTGVIYTTNKKDSVYLPPGDRRTFVAWSDIKKESFADDYWKKMWKWFGDGGAGHVAAYLAKLDISGFDPKAPPPKTAVFWQIVETNSAPEDSELADALDLLGNPKALTTAMIADAIAAVSTMSGFHGWLTDRRNNRTIPHRMEQCGYVSVQNPARKDGRWLIGKFRGVVYVQKTLSIHDQHVAAAELVKARPAEPEPEIPF